MRIICPTCASHYEVEADKIGAEGQLVRCAACREVWLVRASDEAAWQAPPPPAPAMAHETSAFAAAAAAQRPAPTAPIDFAAARARLRRPAGDAHPTGPRRAGLTTLLVLGATCATALGLLAGFRSAIVTHLPGTAPAYAALGLPVRDTTLALTDVHSVLSADGTKTTLSLEGKIANLGDGPARVPNLTVVVRDGAQTPLYTWTTSAPKAELGKGETIAFKSRLASPPASGRDVRVSFAESAPTQPAR